MDDASPAIYEPEALELLGPDPALIPAAIIPVAHTPGTDFERGPRVAVGEIDDLRGVLSLGRHERNHECPFDDIEPEQEQDESERERDDHDLG